MRQHTILALTAVVGLALGVAPGATGHTTVEVTASLLNVRTGPSTGYGKIGSTSSGQVYVTIASSGSWKKIWWSDRTAWFYGGYTKASSVPHASVTASWLNVRRGPGTGYGKVGMIPKGSLWAIVGSSGKWRKIWFEGAARWVHGAYLSTSSTPPPDTGSGMGFINLPSAGTGYYAYSSAYRRWGKSTTVYGFIRAAKSWAAGHPSYPRIGVGDISLEEGGHFPPHVSHREGLDMDIRPVAGSGYEGPLTIHDSGYSSARNEHWFVDHLVKHAPVYRILFNDKRIYDKIGYVRYYSGHHNHHHADFK